MQELAGKTHRGGLNASVQDLVSIATPRFNFLSNRLLPCYQTLFCMVIWVVACALSPECSSSYHCSIWVLMCIDSPCVNSSVVATEDRNLAMADLGVFLEQFNVS
jgi:hypothetical protein